MVVHNANIPQNPYSRENMDEARAEKRQHMTLNIMMNARQAIQHDHGELHISSGMSESEAWVAIEDNGCGIEPVHINRLFEPFFTTKDVGKGTGLGLSLCHSIMVQHSGRIEVQSEVGQYSRFTLYFPVAGLVELPN